MQSQLYTQTIGSSLAENLKHIENGGLNGVPSGFIDLDRLTCGWQKSELIVIAGRPSMGKTSFALSCALNASLQFNKTVAIFSLETSITHVVNRLISAEAQIAIEDLRKGHLTETEWQQIHSKVGRLEAANLIIDDTPSLDVSQFEEKCRALHAKHSLQLIIVDYLQLMTVKGGGIRDRWQEIGVITRALKSMAKELSIPVIALSQLSRAGEGRLSGSKRPILSDLADSGSIEQDADLVLFLYRHEYYGLEEDENGCPTKGLAEVIIAKHRNGETGCSRLKFIGKSVTFHNLDKGLDSFPAAGNAFAGLAPSQDLEKQSNFIIRPSSMNDMEDEPPF